MQAKASESFPRRFGSYTLHELIAQGGMAAVYLATSAGAEGFEKRVALKVIHPEFSEDETFVRALVEEAKISVLLTHVNICQVFDLGRVGGTYFIAMEYIDGIDASRLIEQSRKTNRPIPIEAALYIVAEICQALDYAHKKRGDDGAPIGIVHRDVSPQNVLVGRAGEVKLIDFGVAKASSRRQVTQAGVIKGKYFYMAPEQAVGDSLDSRTDVFGAGAVLYELLTGALLYDGKDGVQELLEKIRRGQYVSPQKRRPDLAPELCAIVDKALATDPRERFSSANTFATALMQYLNQIAPGYSTQRLATLVRRVFPPAPRVASVPAPARPAAARGQGAGRAADAPTGALAMPPVMAPVVVSVPPAPSSEEPTSAFLPGMLEAAAPARSSRASLADNPAQRMSRPPQTARPRPPAPKSVAPKSMDTAGRVTSPAIDVGAEPRTESDVRMSPATLERSDVETVLEKISKPVSNNDVDALLADGFPTFANAPQQAATVAGRVSRPMDPFASIPNAPPAARAVERPADPFAAQANAQSLEGLNEIPKPGFFARFGAFFVFLLACGAVGGAIWYFRFREGPAAVLRIELVSVPAGADVSVDGQSVGKTPFSLTNGVKPGASYSFRLQLDGYESWERRVSVRDSGIREVVVLTSNRAPLHIATTPPGAHIFVNGVPVGNSPLDVEAAPGDVQIRAELEGHTSASQALHIDQPAKATTATLVLAPVKR